MEERSYMYMYYIHSMHRLPRVYNTVQLAMIILDLPYHVPYDTLYYYAMLANIGE